MRRRFESNILKNRLFGKKHKLLLAVSGGIDSVVLAHLLKECGYTFSLAHCNFQLRGSDSERDQAFCEKLARKLNVPVYTTMPDVAAYSLAHGSSTQMSARHLRYAWFEELLKSEKLDYLLTAHHAGDLVETVLINLLRGTGIKGLKGIPRRNGKIVRPLLDFTREEISDYAGRHNLRFRTDKSNHDDKYERNFIRLHVIPKLKQLHPGLERTFLENTAHFTEEEAMVSDVLARKIRRLKQERNGLVHISKAVLKKERYLASLLHALLAPYGFNATQQQNILEHVMNDGLSGKCFYSADHSLTITGVSLVIGPKQKSAFAPLVIHSLKDLEQQPVFDLQLLSRFSMPGKHELIVSRERLIFPLTIRGRQTGDRFQPFGMKGFKLVSDLMKEEKLNAFEKAACRLLVNGNGDIIWVVGHRSDERYRVNKTDKQFLKLTLLD